MNDGDLLSSFSANRQQPAFAEIVRRHGPMVLGVCRSVLGNSCDAEDAAQAVFLTLIHKAASVQSRTTLAGWLYRVSWLVAKNEKRSIAVRARHERKAANMKRNFMKAEKENVPLDMLHTELFNLPEKYRLPVILHHLEGRSQAEVADLLGDNVGTIMSRLNRGRRMLRDRLVKTGVAVSVAGLAAVMTNQAAVAVSSAFVASATKMAACTLAAKTAVAGMASDKVIALSKGAMNMLFAAKIKTAAMLTAAVMLAGGTAVGTYMAVAAGPGGPAATPAIPLLAPPKASDPPRAGAKVFSWQQQHAKVLPNGALEWTPRPFVFEKGDSVRYIDFDAGDDSKDGKTQQSPWKHHPWDAKATGEAKACKGINTYIFKGGVVYRGALKAGDSGEPGNPIRLTSDPAWGKGEGVLYGSTQIKGGWKKGSADEAPGVGQPDKVWYIDLGKDYDPDGGAAEARYSAKFSAIWQVSGDKVERLHIAREPNYDLSDPNNPVKNWPTWSKYDKGKKEFTSPTLKGLGDKNFLNGAVCWTESSFLMGAASRTSIDSYDPDAGTVKLQTRADFNRQHNRVHFMIENVAKFLDAPGEFFFDLNGPKAGRLYLIPPGGAEPNNAVYEVAQIRFPIWIQDKHDIVVSGLEFRYNDPDDGTYSWPPQVGESPCVRIVGNCNSITVKNCKFYYVADAVCAFPRPENEGGPYGVYSKEIGVFANDVMDNIIVSDNDVNHSELVGTICMNGGSERSPGAAYGKLKHVEVMRNRVVDTGFRHGTRGNSNIPAITVVEPETCEIAGNIVDTSYGCGIFTLGGKGSGSHNIVALNRMLVYNNQIDNTMLGCNDYGGLEHFQGGPIYLFNNITRNCVGTRTLGRELGYSLYLDGGFKCYVFNNIIAGNIKPDQADYYNHCGYFMVFGFMNQFFNNTIYHFDKAIDGSSGNRSNILGNLMSDCKETFIGQNRPGDVSMLGGNDTGEMGRMGIPTMAYASNVFFGSPKSFGVVAGISSSGAGGGAATVTGNTLDELRAALEAQKCRLATIGWMATEAPMADPAKKDYRPSANSGAKERGVKYFVPWSLARNVGEWNFFKSASNPKIVLGEGYYMTDEYVSRDMYYFVPRNDLNVSDCTAEDYVAGQLEDWIEGSLKFDGKRVATLAHAEMTKTVGGKNPYDGSKRETLDMGANNFLIEVYFKTEAGHTGGVLASKMAEAGYELAVGPDGGACLTIQAGGAKTSATSAVKVNDGNWHHVIVEADRAAGKAVIYVDGKAAGEGKLDAVAKDAALSNTADFAVGKGLTGAIDFLRVCRATIAEAKTSIDELYAWEFDGPQSRDFCGNGIDGKRDAGAIELGGKPPAGATRVIEARPEPRSEAKPPAAAPAPAETKPPTAAPTPTASKTPAAAPAPAESKPPAATPGPAPAANDQETAARGRLSAAKIYITTDPAKAKDLLRKVITDFPDTQAAKDARQELNKLN
ncbi:MAG: sigma-70 family RNA polymerase sigma factor [Planctomycetes bacterium]|nr:sigma-70 family RNA polymerase sigma factor [Planctomycetota bacterium]